ncbi:hypothetical protein H0E87_013069 [Populus deltoides]|uniref:Wall-associated receptor kinase galacturonan-binding domain-containing protein n=1 Tax=Populus deltoides TaxID=3696 RepID=A0A8T2YM66_POPDE|nr:hypothetical protein H0E87_013069 [Populus deltoides]
MEKSILSMLILMVTLLSCSWSATALQHCGNCGLTPVPFPLSTGPDCGNQQYKLRCSFGKLWFDALNGSSYLIASINPSSTGLQSAYMIKVYDGGCAAYQSFVNLDVKKVGMIKKWPEPGVEIEWALPEEPICNIPVDCKDLLYSKCLPDPISLGQKRCFCDAGFKWDPINGWCQSEFNL